MEIEGPTAVGRWATVQPTRPTTSSNGRRVLKHGVVHDLSSNGWCMKLFCVLWNPKDNIKQITWTSMDHEPVMTTPCNLSIALVSPYRLVRAILRPTQPTISVIHPELHSLVTWSIINLISISIQHFPGTELLAVQVNIYNISKSLSKYDKLFVNHHTYGGNFFQPTKPYEFITGVGFPNMSEGIIKMYQKWRKYTHCRQNNYVPKEVPRGQFFPCQYSILLLVAFNKTTR